MATESRDPQLLYLLHTVDSIYPTGSYAHSMGLEGLVQEGVVADAATLADYLGRSVVPGLAHVDLPILRLAHEAAVDEDVAAIHELSELGGALKGSRELREASLRIGAQRLAMAADLLQHPLLVELRQDVDEGSFSPHANVVFGVETAVAGVGSDGAMEAFAYQTLSGTVAASMKLIRIGQNAAQRVLRDALRQVPDAVRVARSLGVREVGWFSPLLDAASAKHETAHVRLFIT